MPRSRTKLRSMRGPNCVDASEQRDDRDREHETDDGDDRRGDPDQDLAGGIGRAVVDPRRQRQVTSVRGPIDRVGDDEQARPRAIPRWSGRTTRSFATPRDATPGSVGARSSREHLGRRRNDRADQTSRLTSYRSYPSVGNTAAESGIRSRDGEQPGSVLHQRHRPRPLGRVLERGRSASRCRAAPRSPPPRRSCCRPRSAAPASSSRSSSTRTGPSTWAPRCGSSTSTPTTARRSTTRRSRAGCESVSEPQDLDRWPVTVAFIKDPDGYLIELLQNHEGIRPSLRSAVRRVRGHQALLEQVVGCAHRDLRVGTGRGS